MVVLVYLMNYIDRNVSTMETLQIETMLIPGGRITPLPNSKVLRTT